MSKMSKRVLRLLAVVIAGLVGSSALALNPQPEPPIFYHGYQFVLTQVDETHWRWEVRRVVGGRPPEVLDTVVMTGSHDSAVEAARARIDRIANRHGAQIFASPSLNSHIPPYIPLNIGCGIMTYSSVGNVFLFNDGNSTVSRGTTVLYDIKLISSTQHFTGKITLQADLPSGKQVNLYISDLPIKYLFDLESCEITGPVP